MFLVVLFLLVIRRGLSFTIPQTWTISITRLSFFFFFFTAGNPTLVGMLYPIFFEFRDLFSVFRFSGLTLTHFYIKISCRTHASNGPLTIRLKQTPLTRKTPLTTRVMLNFAEVLSRFITHC